MELYKQLPNKPDEYHHSVATLVGYRELLKNLEKFFTANSNYNPRDLAAVILDETNEIKLETLLRWRQ